MKSDTRNHLLDTAQRLFAEQGYASTSLRQITAAAEANLAAVHYHFGSKEELMDELISRKAGPVNVARLANLDRVEADAGANPPALEGVLAAFLMPMSEAADRDPQFVRLMGRMYAEGLLPQIVQRHFQTVATRFWKALRRALPELPEKEFQWRAHFMIGAMAHTMCGVPDPRLVGPAPVDFRSRIERLLVFLAGGFRAPASQADEPVPQPQSCEEKSK